MQFRKLYQDQLNIWRGIILEKRILCFGDSNTWGYDAYSGGRFAKDVRWTGVLQNILGEEYHIIEEGLCGRTTVFDDPLNEGLSGLRYLLPCLQSHSPIDMLIIMLGTNDCKERFSATAKNIADGAKRLIKVAQSADVWNEKPRILLVSPAPIEKECETSDVSGEMGVCSDKSYELKCTYKLCADDCKCEFLDAGLYVSMNKIDYMHLDKESNKRLAEALADVIGKQV